MLWERDRSGRGEGESVTSCECTDTGMQGGTQGRSPGSSQLPPQGTRLSPASAVTRGTQRRTLGLRGQAYAQGHAASSGLRLAAEAEGLPTEDKDVCCTRLWPQQGSHTQGQGGHSVPGH